jgi:hypothetical protein
VGSDEEFLRKVSAMRDKFNRSDSDETGLGFSHINLNKPFHGMEPFSNKSTLFFNIAVDRRLNFDELKEKKFDGRKVAASPFKHRLLGEIGKTRSAGDLLSPWKRNDIQINAPNTTKLPRWVLLFMMIVINTN